MIKILKLFFSDMNRLVHNFFALVIIIGLCVIPSLYAWFNIYSNWDPYANTSNIQVAVATDDVGYTLDDGTEENMGDEVIDELKENDKIGWVFTDTDDAIQGVKDGRYYASVVIGKDFTESMENVFTEDFQEATITYYENEKKNAVATKITDSAVETLKQSINEKFIKVLTKNLMSETNEVGQKIEDSDQLTALQDKLINLQSNLTAYNKTIDVILNGNEALQDSLDRAESSLDTAKANVSNGQQDIDQAKSSMDTLDQASTSLSDIDNNIQANLEAIQGYIGDLQTELDTLNESDSMEQVTEAVQNLAIDAANLEIMLNDIQTQISELLNDSDTSADSRQALEDLSSTATTMAQYSASILQVLDSTGVELPDQVTEAIETAGNAGNAINQVINTISSNDIQASTSNPQDLIDTISSNDISIQTPGSVDGIKKSVSNMSDMLANLQTLYDEYLEPETNQVESQLRDVLDQASQLLSTLDGSLTDMKSVYSGVGDTVDSTDASLEEMQNVIQITNQKLSKLIDRIDDADNNEIIDLVLDLAEGDPDTYSEFFASPMEMQTQSVYPIDNYGSAMTPFYTVLALWVGGLLLTALIKVKPDPKKIPGATEVQLFFGRYLLFFVLGQVQTAIVVLGNVYLLHCQILNVGLFWLAASVTSLVFTLLIYSLTLSFGDVGKAIAVVMVVIQIAGSGGTYPIELLPDIYSQIYTFFPFPYAIAAMREMVAGVYGNTYLINILELLLFGVAALLLGLVIRKPFVGLNHFMEKRMEDTELM